MHCLVLRQSVPPRAAFSKQDGELDKYSKQDIASNFGLSVGRDRCPPGNEYGSGGDMDVLQLARQRALQKSGVAAPSKPEAKEAQQSIAKSGVSDADDVSAGRKRVGSVDLRMELKPLAAEVS